MIKMRFRGVVEADRHEHIVRLNLVGAKTEAISFRVGGRRDLKAIAIVFMASPSHVAASAVGTGYDAPP